MAIKKTIDDEMRANDETLCMCRILKLKFLLQKSELCVSRFLQLEFLIQNPSCVCVYSFTTGIFTAKVRHVHVQNCTNRIFALKIQVVKFVSGSD